MKAPNLRRVLSSLQSHGSSTGEEADLILMGYGGGAVNIGAISPSVGYEVGGLSEVVDDYDDVGNEDDDLEHVGYDDLGAPLYRRSSLRRRSAGRPAGRPRGGAVSRGFSRANPRGARASASPEVSRVYSALPGIPQQGSLMQPMPIIDSAFTSASGTNLPLNQAPTKGFRPRRLVYVETRTGASATGLVKLNAMAIGSRLQSVAAGNLAAQQYAPGAYDTDVKWDDLQPGVPLTGNVIITAAPTTVDRVDFSLSCNGETLS